MKNKTKKEYEVHITLGDYIVEGVMAKDGIEAEKIARKRFEADPMDWVGESQEIVKVEAVEIQAGKNCDNCGLIISDLDYANGSGMCPNCRQIKS